MYGQHAPRSNPRAAIANTIVPAVPLPSSPPITVLPPCGASATCSGGGGGTTTGQRPATTCDLSEMFLAAIFQYKIVVFQGKFSISSAFSIEKIENIGIYIATRYM